MTITLFIVCQNNLQSSFSKKMMRDTVYDPIFLFYSTFSRSFSTEVSCDDPKACPRLQKNGQHWAKMLSANLNLIKCLGNVRYVLKSHVIASPAVFCGPSQFVSAKRKAAKKKCPEHLPPGSALEANKLATCNYLRSGTGTALTSAGNGSLTMGVARFACSPTLVGYKQINSDGPGDHGAVP